MSIASDAIRQTIGFCPPLDGHNHNTNQLRRNYEGTTKQLRTKIKEIFD